MKKRKSQLSVLHVLPTRVPEYGGPVVVAEALVDELIKQSVEAKIYPPSNATAKYINLFKIPSLVKNSNLIHIHGLWNLPSLIAAFVARASNIPYVITPHGMLDKWSLKKSKIKKIIYGFLFEKKNLSAAASIQFLNKEEQDEAKDYCIFYNSFILPNGVNAEQYRYLPDRMSFLQNHIELEKKVLALFLGRLHPKKGFNILLPALAKAVTESPNLHLLIAGPDEGQYKIELLKMIEQYNLRRHITFLGMVKNEKKKEVLSAADFFVLPSHQEGDSIAVKEAMACGLPVVITPACHFPEVSNLNSGLVINPDVDECFNILIELSKNQSTRKKMGKNAISLINDKYTWHKIAAQLKLIYEEILQKGS